jgi:ribosomal-protein-alanine N-acetyltransferase
MFKEPVITERCMLRRLSYADNEHIWSAAHTPGFTDGMTWDPPKTMAELDAFTKMSLEEWEKGTKYLWTITSRENGEFIGRMEVKKADELPGNVWGLGYFIHPLQQGKGYATEAATAAIKFAFEKLNADSIVSSHHDWNLASGKVLTKIGMKHTGFTEDRVIKDGKPVRAAEFWLDKSDWEASLL